MKGFLASVATAALTAVGVVAIAGSASATPASAAGALPVITLTLTGKAVTVSGSTVSGAVRIHTVIKEANGQAVLVHLNPGVTPAQIRASERNQDPNGVSQVGAIVFDAGGSRGTSDAQTVLSAGKYIALDVGQNGPPRGQSNFTVSASSSPARLPRPSATQTAIEFGFRGPTVLHDNTLVRGVNGGWLVHMINLVGVRSAADGRRVIKLLRAGNDRAAQRLATGFVSIEDVVSHGAVVQSMLHTKPGWYVEACFMDTQDGREHTRLGMERLVRVVK